MNRNEYDWLAGVVGVFLKRFVPARLRLTATNYLIDRLAIQYPNFDRKRFMDAVERSMTMTEDYFESLASGEWRTIKK